MSRAAQEFGDKLRKFLQPPDVTLDGEVTAVSEADYTCTVKMANGLELEGVHLKALKTDTQGVIIVPQVGSTVQIINLGDPDWLVVACEAVDTVIINAAVKARLQCNDIVINGGGNAGLVKVAELTGKINTLEADLNKLKAAFNTWVPSGGDGGAALKAAAAPWAGQTIMKTAQADIENPNVKH